MNSFKALVKREYWESKGSMLYTPVTIAAFVAIVMVLGVLTGGSLQIDDGSHSFNFTEKLIEGIGKIDSLSEGEQDNLVQSGLYFPTVLFGFVMFVIGLFYCLGSLYDERKDKSILFWKSLPVSDTATVLSKFVAISLLIPVIYFAAISVFQVFLLIFATILSWISGSSGVTIWTSSNLFGVLFNGLFSAIVASLWMAPVWGWLLLASSWAKKVAFLWGTVPIFLIVIAEGWIFGSARFFNLVGERIGHGFVTMNSNLLNLLDKDIFDGRAVSRWYEVLGESGFWIGLIVAAGFLAGAIYARRYRDES